MNSFSVRFYCFCACVGSESRFHRPKHLPESLHSMASAPSAPAPMPSRKWSTGSLVRGMTHVMGKVKEEPLAGLSDADLQARLKVGSYFQISCVAQIVSMAHMHGCEELEQKRAETAVENLPNLFRFWGRLCSTCVLVVVLPTH